MADSDDAHTHELVGEYRFCPMCTTELEDAVVAGTTRRRCPNCDFVHWRNPGVGAAVVVRDADRRLLLIRRGSAATRSGFWAIPAGFVDYGEEVKTAAARELLEETGLVAEVGDVVFVASNFHDPAKLTVGVWFEGTVVGGELEPGDDADDAGFFALDDLPPLAFETDEALIARLRCTDRGEGAAD
jgi:ADP-ribose pyrophosphatase YjhB (NUDIX family)